MNERNQGRPDAQGRCAIGILTMEIVPGAPDDRLKAARRQLEGELRQEYGQATREALKALAPLDAYAAYYKKFGYTYHVLLQLESVAKGKPIPDALPAVAAMFMAELKNGILTAGHDLDVVRRPLKCLAATGGETYTTLGGKNAICIAGDWRIADQEGILSSILRGPDQRTAITGHTKRVLYTAYAPEGVPESMLEQHLGDIEGYLCLFCGSNAPGFRKVVPVDAGGFLPCDAGEV